MMSRLVIVYLVVVAYIIVSSGIFFINENSRSTITSGMSTANTENESSLTALSTDRDGLETFLSINASTIVIGQAINISVYDFNPAASNHTVNIIVYLTSGTPRYSVPDYPAPGMNLRACGGGLISMSLYGGYYTASNISGASPLQIFYPGDSSCPSSGLVFPQYIFLPQSSQVVTEHGSETMRDSERFYGYFITGYNCSYFNGTTILDTEPQCPLVQLFSSGIYTIAGGDRLGGLVILHLNVLQ